MDGSRTRGRNFGSDVADSVPGAGESGSHSGGDFVMAGDADGCAGGGDFPSLQVGLGELGGNGNDSWGALVGTKKGADFGDEVTGKVTYA